MSEVKRVYTRTKNKLVVELDLRFPDINRGKSYSDSLRAYIVKINKKEVGRVDMTTTSQLFISAPLGSIVTIDKRYGDKSPDSTMTYEIGEGFATLKVDKGSKKIAIKFEGKNIINVKDDYDFKWKPLNQVS